MSKLIGGADADRTRDLLNAIQALSQTELQPHRWRDFSANRILPVESTDRFQSVLSGIVGQYLSIKAVKRGDVSRRHQKTLVVGDAFEIAGDYFEGVGPGRV